MTTTPYRCKNEQRRQWVAEVKANGTFRLNGIDYLEVDPDDQKVLKLHFLHTFADVEGYTPLTKDNVLIAGGVRIRDIRIMDPFIVKDSALILSVDQPGDFSLYTLRIVDGAASEKPPVWIDPLLSEVAFSFKVNCPSDFDCRPRDVCPPIQIAEPRIDYLAKDYGSFRQLMLDRMGLLLPACRERNAADLGVALVELLAYTGDRLSYRQDAVATEAYLGTARKRVSLRRHARLLDYPVHDGCNARAWVQIRVKPGGDGIPIAGPRPDKNLPGTLLMTRTDPPQPVLSLNETQLSQTIDNGSRIFETMHDLTLYEAHNVMSFYTWGDEGCCLPAGSTRGFLRDNVEGRRLMLRSGDILIFVEERSPETGLEADADPARRHAVRLVSVHPEAQVDTAGIRSPGTLLADPLFPDQAYVEIRWHEEDVLPFNLCVHDVEDPDTTGRQLPVSVALGNVVLVDHGQTITEVLAVTADKRYRPTLSQHPVTRQGCRKPAKKKTGTLIPVDPEGSAHSAFVWEAGYIKPAVKLVQDGNAGLVWLPRNDLLGSDPFSREFVVEVEEDGRAALRFGDGVMGQKPDPDMTFAAHYRIGNGSAGNVGAGAIAHVVVRSDSPPLVDIDWSRIGGVENPLAARGGAEAETKEQIRAYAPRAFQRQERAVNARDYAEMAERHPDNQKAAATVRWTGSWYTVYLTIDRKGGRTVDPAFIEEMKAFLDCYRMAGYDIEINGPRSVPLDVSVAVCVKPGYFAMDVKEALLDVFSNRTRDDGSLGFFHPDNFTFGQAVYLSRIYAAAMAIDGVANLEVTRFQRWGRNADREIEEGKLPVGRLDVVRLDNDPNFPENGKIDFLMREDNG